MTVHCDERRFVMVWFFKRGDQALQVQTRFDNGPREYVLEIIWPDRPSETERYSDLAAFEDRVTNIEERLKAESWSQIGSPEILPDGWRGPIAH